MIKHKALKLGPVNKQLKTGMKFYIKEQGVKTRPIKLKVDGRKGIL